MKIRINKRLPICCSYLLVLFYLHYLSESLAQYSNQSVKPINIISVSEKVNRTYCTIDTEVIIKYKPIDVDSVKFVFDSVWIFTPISYRKLTLITKHFVSKISFKIKDTCLLTLNFKQKIGSEGIMAEPRECQSVPSATNLKIGNVQYLLPETLRLYFTYKGKYKIAKYYKRIANRPTFEEVRKKLRESQMHEGDND